jgi:Domain of unknown function (DUF362)
MKTDLERALLGDVQRLLDSWAVRYHDRPDRERLHLLMLALEREQIVAVAYREEAVAGRLAELHVDHDTKALIRQTLVWIWKDEQLHAEYLRGELLRQGGVGSHAVVYGRMLQGALSGWTSATANHRDPHRAPFRSGAASVLVTVAGLSGQVPPALRHELKFQTFHRYCLLNVALEASAALAYRRLIELADTEEDRRVYERLREDEERHVAAYALFTDAVMDGGGLAEATEPERLAEQLEAICPWFIPAARRARRQPKNGGGRARTFGSGAPVAVRSAWRDQELDATLRACLDAAGLKEQAAGARSAAIRASFMLGYDCRDRSNVNSSAVLDALARYLRDHGVEDVAVLEAPTVYGNAFANRSVEEVARYFGFISPRYRIVDISEDLRPCTFERGFVQHAITGQWLDADLRIVVPKLRTDPTEFAHLGLSTLEGSTGAIDATFYSGRQVDFRSATMMLLDVAPPDFCLVDAWAPVADGPFGVMGCSRPADVRHLYGGRDLLTVDEAVLADLGVTDPRKAPILRLAYHWFGLDPAHPPIDGDRPDLAHELRGAHRSPLLRGLGIVAYPIYMYLSGAGDRFVPAMDVHAFPPRQRPSPSTRLLRRAAQLAFGLHPPTGLSAR